MRVRPPPRNDSLFAFGDDLYDEQSAPFASLTPCELLIWVKPFVRACAPPRRRQESVMAL